MEADRSQRVIGEIRETPGRWLYHYTTLETALVHILSTQHLRLSPFSKMRDPREYKEWIPGAVGYATGSLGEDFTRGHATQAARANQLRDEFKLLALTTDSERANEGVYGRGFARSRLWDAYAGRSAGVCLVLNKEEALRVIAPQLDALGTAAHGQVCYENRTLDSSIMMQFEDIYSGRAEATAERIAAEHLEEVFFTKNTEWESEREYRFVVRSPAEYEYVDISKALVAVCRGPESAKEAEHALRYFANELNIAIGLVQWNHNRPMLLGRRLTEMPKTESDEVPPPDRPLTH
jgi:hypothetical protein